jgi:hypothetical protein
VRFDLLYILGGGGGDSLSYLPCTIITFSLLRHYCHFMHVIPIERYWFNDTAPAVGVYGDVLSPPRSVTDVVHWLNYLSAARDDDDGAVRRRTTKYAAINAAVEATTLNERTLRLRRQDVFLRDHISSGDVLIVSIGGNDIALCPTPCTMASMAGLLCLPTACLNHGRSFGAVPVSLVLLLP